MSSGPPIITSIYPTQGGAEGGTRLTIYGYNFAQNGIFSSYNVYIGGEPCSVIKYYSTNGQIVCLTPKCRTTACESPTWQGSQKVSLSIYLQTVESILGTSSTFTYTGAFTPQIIRMSHSTWGTATSSITGKFAAAYLDDISVFVGGGGNIGSSNYGDLGEPGEINNEIWGNSNYWWGKQEYTIYYHPPSDLAGGFYNLSVVVQDLEQVGWGSGSARTFPTQYPLSYVYTNGDATHQYLYDTSLSGAPYNLCLFPTVSRIFPKIGSVGGGTTLTIRGGGFSLNSSRNIIYAGGEPCTVLTVDSTTLTCQTAPVSGASLAAFERGVLTSKQIVFGTPQDIPSVPFDWVHNSSRSYGSSGWWVKVWDWNAFNAQKFPDSDVRLSFTVHEDLSFSLYRSVGGDWYSQLNYQSKLNEWSSFYAQSYVADYITTLVAPYSGYYFFYILSSDDETTVYGASYNATGPGPETLLVSSAYANINVQWSNRRKSRGVFLRIGDRYQLRSRLVNYAGPDDIHLALEVQPLFFNGSSNVLLDAAEYRVADLPLEANPVPLTPSETFLHHHSVKDVQQLQLSMLFQREMQVSP